MRTIQHKKARQYALAAGILYLIIIICAGFSQGYVRESIIVPGDAIATANNILASEQLFRLGFVSDLIAFMCDLAVSVLLYLLLKPVSKSIAMIAAAFRLLAHPAIAAVNMLNHFTAMLLLDGQDYLAVFEPAQLQALAMLSLEIHSYGYDAAGMFFGVHCILLGHLLYKSELFPSLLGVLLQIAGVGYLTESIGNAVSPGNGDLLAWFVAAPAAVAEVSFCLWLIIKKVKTI